MRLVMDTLIALMLTSILAGVMWQNRSEQTVRDQRETTRAELRRFQQQIALQAALAQVERNERGYPSTVDPSWFAGQLPQNTLLGPEHPWVEVASPEERDFKHPLESIAGAKHIAKFWYNPANGTVRARVPAGVSDAASLELYNFVNDSALPTLFAGDR